MHPSKQLKSYDMEAHHPPQIWLNPHVGDIKIHFAPPPTPPTQTHPPVGVVEEHLHRHQVHEEVENGGGEGGQLVAALVAPQEDQGVGGEVEDGTHDEGVEGDKHQCLLILLPAHLQRGRKQERRWNGMENRVLTRIMQ